MGAPDAIEVAVDPEVVERFPEVQVAAIVAVDVDRAHAALADGAGSRLLAEAAEAVRAAFPAPDQVAADERIAAWRAAIRACGLKASDVRSSVEQLVRRLLRDDDLGAAIPLVQAYCALSAKHVAPLGGYDVDRLPPGALTLRPADPGDAFEPLGGSAEKMPLDPRVVVYGAGDEVLCWAFNHRDSARTALRPETTRAAFVGEAVTAAQRPGLAAALAELAQVLERHGASVSDVAVVDAERPRASL